MVKINHYPQKTKYWLLKIQLAKERELAEETQLDNDSLKQKSKELSDISIVIKEFEVIETKQNKALLDCDNQIRELEKKKKKNWGAKKKTLQKKKKKKKKKK